MSSVKKRVCQKCKQTYGVFSVSFHLGWVCKMSHSEIHAGKQPESCFTAKKTAVDYIIP